MLMIVLGMILMVGGARARPGGGGGGGGVSIRGQYWC